MHICTHRLCYFQIQIPSHQILTACIRIRNERYHHRTLGRIITIIIIRIHICMMIRFLLTGLDRMWNNDTGITFQQERFIIKPFEFYCVVTLVSRPQGVRDF